MTPATRVSVYEADNTTHVTDLYVEPVTATGPTRAPSAVETARVLSGIEAGQVIVQTDHPEADELTCGRVLRVTEGGDHRAPFTITRRREVRLSDKGHVGETLTLTGKTLLDRWRKATVFPWNGPERRPVGRERIWDVCSPTFDDSAWTTPFVQSRDYGGPPAGMFRPRAWIGPSSEWIWSRADSSVQPSGRVPFRYHFTLEEETQVVIFFSADNDYRVTIDGVDIDRSPLPVPDYIWQRTYRGGLLLPAGDHVFAAVCQNWWQFDDNPAGFIAEAWQTNGNRVIGDDPIFYTGSSGWLTLDYPDPWPGYTVGQILTEFLAEVQARDELPGWSCDFDADEDSDGNPWPQIPQHSIRVGASGWDLIQSLGAWSEVSTATEGLVLRAYDLVNADGKGSASGVNIVSGFNALNIVRTEDIDELANSVLVSHKEGFRVRDDDADIAVRGRLGSTLEIGEVSERAMVEALGDQFVEVHRDPQVTWLVDVIERDGAVPGVDFEEGDTITIDGGDELRVMGIRWVLRGDGTLRPILQVQSLLEAKALHRRRVQDRLTQLAGGGFGASSPIIDTGSKIKIGELGNAPDIVFSWSADDVEDDDVSPMDQPKEFCRLYEATALADWEDPETSEKLTHGDTVLQVLDAGTPVSGLEAITIPEEASSVTVSTWFTYIGPADRLRLRIVSWGGHENGSVKLKCAEPV